MTNNIWEMLEEYFSQDRSDYFCEGAKELEIVDAEKKLGLVFSQGYKKLLSLYDSVDLPGYTIYGTKPLPDSNGGELETVIDNTNFYKNTQKWPGIEDWYVISDDGSGNPIGMNPKGEVWLSDHDSAFEHIKLADNFEEFVYRLLTDTLYE